MTRFACFLFLVIAMVACSADAGPGPDPGGADVPAAPAKPSAVAGDAQVTLSWPAVSGATGYRVFFNLDAAGALSRVSSPSHDAAAATTFTVTSLQNGGRYRFAITARNGAGEGALSPEISITPSASVGLSVISSDPADGAISVAATTTVSVAFNKPVARASMTASTTGTVCTGTLQLSSDEFQTCLPMSGNPEPSSFDKVFTATPAAPLNGGLLYKLRVTKDAKDAAAIAMASDYTSSVGFKVEALFAVTSTAPADGAAGIATGASIGVTFTRPAAPATLTVSSSGTGCTGSLQLSSDGFTTCVALGAPTASNGGATFTAKPVAALGTGTKYAIRVTTAALDLGGGSIGSTFTTPAGFTTVAGPLLVASVSPPDGVTNVATQTAIIVNFTKPAFPGSVTVSTFGTACTGSFQLSSDNFTTCVAMAGAPAPTNANKTYTVVPLAALAAATTYKIRLTTAVQDTNGVALAAPYTTPTGFTTR